MGGPTTSHPANAFYIDGQLTMILCRARHECCVPAHTGPRMRWVIPCSRCIPMAFTVRLLIGRSGKATL